MLKTCCARVRVVVSFIAGDFNDTRRDGTSRSRLSCQNSPTLAAVPVHQQQVVEAAIWHLLRIYEEKAYGHIEIIIYNLLGVGGGERHFNFSDMSEKISWAGT